MNRYEDKPFLELLDSYVLRAIGALDPDKEAILDASEVHLQEVWNLPGRWHDIVASRMRFSADQASHINMVWLAAREDGARLGAAPTPLEFTRLFVDVNYAG